MAYDGKMWVAGGSPGATGASLAYSYDGINWTASANGNSIMTDVRGISGSGSRWVAVGNGTNQIAYSDDGITWTGAGNSFFPFVFGKAIDWNGSMWVAGGGINAIPSPPQLRRSTDGITWTSISTSMGWGYVSDVLWGGNKWLASGGAGGNNPMAYSYDGITWTQISGQAFNSLITGLAYDSTSGYWSCGGRFVPGKIAYSADGITWATSTSGGSLFSSYPTNTISNGGGFISLVGSTLGYSRDGINWSSVSFTGLSSVSAFATNIV